MKKSRQRRRFQKRTKKTTSDQTPNAKAKKERDFV
jgi:hypothetical protein